MGKTIIISSHILPELAEMVDEIGVIEHGEMVAVGNINHIQQQLMAKRQLSIKTSSRQDELKQFLNDQPHVQGVFVDGQTLEVQFSGQDVEQAALLKAILLAGFEVISYQEAQTDLEDIFLAITKGGGAEQ